MTAEACPVCSKAMGEGRPHIYNVIIGWVCSLTCLERYWTHGADDE